MTTDDWKPIDYGSVPRGRVIMTRIDDDMGVRNEQPLFLNEEGRLWFVPNASMYVYYAPTHWRELTDDEANRGRVALLDAQRANDKTTADAIARLSR